MQSLGANKVYDGQCANGVKFIMEGLNKSKQGCALVAPSGSWRLTCAPGN